MSDRVSVAVAISCSISISNQSSQVVSYSINGGPTLMLQRGQTANPQINNFNLNQVRLTSPKMVFRNGNSIGNSIQTFTASQCNENFTLYDPVNPQSPPFPFPQPIPNPFPQCSSNQYLLYVAQQINGRQQTEQQLINLVAPLSVQQINTLICIPQINNAYLLELAIIQQYVQLTSFLLQKGANPNLTSDTQGRSILRQLLESGSYQNNPNIQQIIQLLIQYGARYF